MGNDHPTDSHTPPGEQTTGSEFRNYDLKAIAPEAQKPTVQFAFDFPELLVAFETADAAAGKSRDRNRRIGIAGILLVLAALVYASATPVLDQLMDKQTRVAIGSFAAVAGLVGTGLGVMGLLRKSQRQAWLEARLTTELLRLFHFRYIAANVDQILAAATDPQRQADYRTARRAVFEMLRGQLQEPKTALDMAIRRDGPDQGRARYFGVAFDYTGTWTVSGNRACYDHPGPDRDTCSLLTRDGDVVRHYSISSPSCRNLRRVRASGRA